MSRSKKLLFVGLVLAVGFGLAWPFRRTSEKRATADRPNADRGWEAVAKTQAIDFWGEENSLGRQPLGQSQTVGSPAPHVVAKMTSLGDASISAKNPAPTASFDLANHPALASPLAPRSASPVTAQLPPEVQPRQAEAAPAQVQRTHEHGGRDRSRPAYSTINRDRAYDFDEQREDEVRHVVQNSDTLEKLAKRYLGDEGRALEIFDLNRDVLDNPHLLPIKAQLRIPGRISDQ